MGCARGDRVLALALGTLLVCGAVNTALAVVEGTWWAWVVGGACLVAASDVTRRWFRPPSGRSRPLAATARFTTFVPLPRHDDVDAAA